MKDAYFWYDKMSAYGSTPDTDHDMISEAFWRTRANEIKLREATMPHTQRCWKRPTIVLRGKHFVNLSLLLETFVTVLATSWASDACLGSCTVRYGRQYQRTSGFEKYGFSSDIQSSNYIGFWCDWSGGNGAVMMNGGGGSGCHRADHGIGITEEAHAMFGGTDDFLDFGHDTDNSHSYKTEGIQTSYALKLWVR